MFTGIVEEVGRVLDIQKSAYSAVIKAEAKKILEDVKDGDSIAVNGVCLTVTAHTDNVFWADVMQETMRRSSMGGLSPGSHVNLERALRADGRFGGHIVTGHIDGTGIIQRIRRDEMAIWYTIETEEKLMRQIVEKGSIAVDGISLTVAEAAGKVFSVSVIPHTASHTILTEKGRGDIVNLETDCLGKYVAHLLVAGEKTNPISAAFLAENGF